MQRKKGDIFTLPDSDEEYIYIDTIEYRNGEYLILHDEEEDEFYVVEVVHIDYDTEDYYNVDDDIVDAVSCIFFDKWKEEFNFE